MKGDVLLDASIGCPYLDVSENRLFASHTIEDELVSVLLRQPFYSLAWQIVGNHLVSLLLYNRQMPWLSSILIGHFTDVRPFKSPDVGDTQTAKAGEHECLLDNWNLTFCFCQFLHLLNIQENPAGFRFLWLLTLIYLAEWILVYHPTFHGSAEHFVEVVAVHNLGVAGKRLAISLLGVVQELDESHTILLVNAG